MPLNSKGDCAKCKRAGREQNPDMCSDCGVGYCPHCDGGCGCDVEPEAPVVPETYGDLKRMLARCSDGDWPSRVNPSMTHTQALTILRNGLATHADDQRLDSTPRGGLYARNVQRECLERT